MYATNEQNSLYTDEIKYYDQLHKEKYRDKNQTHKEHSELLANNLSSDSGHKSKLFNMVWNHRFLAGGRVQTAFGATQREVSPFSCAVSLKIEDSMKSIGLAHYEALQILRLGTGIGYNFSHLRPSGALIKKLGTNSCGPIRFIDHFDDMASLITSAGHRRGAQMAILNVDHPDIEHFIDAKMEKGRFSFFNFSVGISDKFMEAVNEDLSWDLIHEGTIYTTKSARDLWFKIINNAYESAEPGLVFLDRMNKENNLYYCEQIEATNPCSEQPLPPHGVCTLGSFNLVGYLIKDNKDFIFDYNTYVDDIKQIVEAYDNIFEDAKYAIPEHEEEAKNKRRIGLGLTGIANAIELLEDKPCYGEKNFCDILDDLAKTLTYVAYETSIELSKKKGPFKLFDPIKYTGSKFVQTLPMDIQRKIEMHGIRNSHLISYAPCGTISQCAWNVSSGVEPVFYHEVDRKVHLKDGKINVTLRDFAYREHNFKGKTLEECSIEDHLNVAEIVQKYCDSSVSKTINVKNDCSYEEYQETYKRAYNLGLKGITVFRPTELRGAVITKAVETVEIPKDHKDHTVVCFDGLCERNSAHT